MPRQVISITATMFQRALREAKRRHQHTSRRHDYHNGTEKARLEKYLAGCLGEEMFRSWLTWRAILFVQEERKAYQPDRADFWIEGGRSVNVKAELPGRRRFSDTLLVTVEEVEKRACDIYVAVRLEKERKVFTAGWIMGLASLEKVKAAPVVNGFEKDYAILYTELREIRTMLQPIQTTQAS